MSHFSARKWRTRQTRRQFLKAASTSALVALSAPATHGRPPSPVQGRTNSAEIPLHRPLDLPGVHAYADTQSVMAGTTIRFHVSSTLPYRMAIHRLGTQVDDPASDRLLKRFEVRAPTPQSIHPGSYVYIAKRLAGNLRQLTLECWVRPWNLDRLQGLISQEDKEDARGFALGIGAGGYVGFYVGDGVSPDEAVVHRTRTGVLTRRRWHHVVATWDGQTKAVWVDGVRAGEWTFRGECLPGPHPLRLGAMSARGVSTHFLDGDLALPVIYKRTLFESDVMRRFRDQGLTPPPNAGVLGCWPLSEERGDVVSDVGPQHRHGRVINHGTWMIGGPSFDGTRVPRFGTYRPEEDTQRGHGLRLAADDLYDCRWAPTHQWQVPADARPGIYVARIQAEHGSRSIDYPVTFLVRRARTRRPAPILVLCSTSTWLAYNAVPFGECIPPGTNLGTNGYRNSHPEAPAFSCYRDHHAGQPSFQFGLRMPWPSAGPQVLYSSQATGYSHLMRGERFLHSWLEQEGYDFDVASDLDLHRDPGMLARYRTVLINGHSEYWSLDARGGLDTFLTRGGTAIVLSGNTLFWRTTFNREGTVMECRKFDERIGGRGGAPIGELYHSHDQARGSLLRECGFPAWEVIGLECSGWGGTEAKDAGVYHTEAPDHFLFHQPEPVGLKPGETFGHSPDGSSYRAVGHEYDLRLRRLAALTSKIPVGAALPTEPDGITTLALGKRAATDALDYFTQPTKSPDGVLAEMIYWTRPQGGRVFHAGAIGAGWALAVDPKFQKLMRNVLHHFGVRRPTAPTR